MIAQAPADDGPVDVPASRILKQLDAVVCEPARASLLGDPNTPSPDGRCVIYWMMRAHRSDDNLALETALACARSLELPLVVLFRLGHGPRGSAVRHVEHMLRGLPAAAAGCTSRGATFVLADPASPAPGELLAGFAPAIVITDADVMHGAVATRRRAAQELPVPLICIDTDTIVPTSLFPTREYAARTIRPKVHRVLERYLVDSPASHITLRPPEDPASLLPSRSTSPGLHLWEPAGHRFAGTSIGELLELVRRLGIDDAAQPVTENSGQLAAATALDAFVKVGVHGYDERRNKPEFDGTSRLSHHIHYGHLSPRAAVLAVRQSGAAANDIDGFVEQLVVRRELAWNFVCSTADVTTLAGAAPDWALRTLDKHASDPRPWLYDEAELEAAATHDPLWNAAQRQMQQTGLMHGYVRMYWAKKILEWSPDAATAYDVALRLNDRWHLDGRDPNGIVGVAWAIGGVHDRPWGERDIFGTIRFMSLASTGRKFDSKSYIARWGGDAQLTLG